MGSIDVCGKVVVIIDDNMSTVRLFLLDPPMVYVRLCGRVTEWVRRHAKNNNYH